MISKLTYTFIPDSSVVRRAERIIAEYSRSRVEMIAARPGNPRRAQIRHYGEAVALRVPPFGENFSTAHTASATRASTMRTTP